VSEERYILLPAAEADLIESTAYLLENASNVVALRFIRSVFGTSRMLSGMPGIGVACHFKKRESRGIRRFAVKSFRNWLVFYRSTSHGIEVVRVISGRRDWGRLFE
jgi:toxin ParE1/3/4